jgi:hypothetical protein
MLAKTGPRFTWKSPVLGLKMSVPIVGERLDRRGLGQARHAFQQHVAVREEADHQLLQHVPLADHGAAHLVQDLLDEGAFPLHLFRNGLDVNLGRASHAHPLPSSLGIS